MDPGTDPVSMLVTGGGGLGGGAIDLTWPMAAVAIAYVVSQAVVDATRG